MTADLAQQLEQLKLGDHICPIHDGTASLPSIWVPYIRIGLERGERCVCIADRSRLDEIARVLRRAGIPVEQERERGALVFVASEDTPFASDAPDITKMMEYVRKTEEVALADGFAGARCAGSSTWMLRPGFDSRKLIEYEAMVNRALAGRRIMVLCDYDRSLLDDALIHDALRTHPLAVIDDLICPNPYYEPPELLLKRDKMAEAEFKRKRVDWWIARLKAARAAEQRRERAEAALHEQEEHVRLLLDSAAEAIYGTDLEGNCTFANPATVRLLGYPDSAAILGKNMHRLMHHSRADGTPYPPEECPLLRVLRTGEAVHVDDEVMWRADGTQFAAEYWSYPMYRGGRMVGAVVTFLDISERRALEEQIRQTQRMEALGQLTGGIAHDFNNLLTVVLGNADMIVQDNAENEELRQQAEIIRAAAERGADLIGRMLAFARRQPLHPRTVDVNELIRSMEGLLKRSLGAQIEIVYELAEDAWPSLVDPSQLETAILNLAINAHDAMHEGGRLIVGTANVRLGESFRARYPEATPGDYVTIGVTDTGVGMPPEVVEQAPQPFFTTKEPGKGTGLGLSMVYGFVKQSGGHMEIASEPGRGTTVTLYLPRGARPTPEMAEDGQEGRAPHATGGEVILLVEDDDLVRGYVVTQLRALGYRVIEVSDGNAALAALREHPDVQLLFTDVVMPGGLSGPALAEQAATLRPDLKVLFTSGYSSTHLVREGRLPEGVHLLVKPYRPSELAAELRRVLDE
ncbi:MAG: hypothetical protein BroJett029_09180 [Alphaproteobacteria bacterium]|nr:MAG: hypothetical protein BroJett029_09180 [Alphaproteobacteria bacterium]